MVASATVLDAIWEPTYVSTALTLGYFTRDPVLELISVIKLLVDCAPKLLSASFAVVAPVPPFEIAIVLLPPIFVHVVPS